jgi:hypothetical protein
MKSVDSFFSSIESSINSLFIHNKKPSNSVVLTEDDPSAITRKITLQVKDKTQLLVYKFDKVVVNKHNEKIKEIFLMLAEKKPLRSKCDYIIFYKSAKRISVVVCNLKSFGTGNCEDQFFSGNIFAKFLIDTAFRCHKSWNSSKKKEIQFTETDLKEYVNFSELAVFANKNLIPKGPIKHKQSIPRINCSKDEIIDLSIRFGN